MQQGLFTRLVVVLGRAFGRAADYLATPDALQELLDSLGWTVPSVSGAYSSVQAPAQVLLAAVQSLSPQPTYADLAQVVQRLIALLNALAALPVTAPAGVNDPDFTHHFRERLLAKLLTDGIQDNLPTLYYLLAVVGIIAPVDDPLDTRRNRVLNLERLQALLTAPTDYPSKYLGWGLDFVLNSQRQVDVLGLLDSLGVTPALLDSATAAGSGLQALITDQADRNLLLFPLEQQLLTSQQRLLSLVVQPTTVFSQKLTETDLTDVAVGDEIEESVTNTPGDELRFYLLPHVNVSTELALSGNVKLAIPFIQTLQNGFSFTIGPAGFGLADEQNTPVLALTLDPAVVLSYTPTEPIIFIGEPGKTRLQADALELALSLSISGGAKLKISAVNSQLIINGDEGNSFLSKVLPNTAILVPLGVALSSADGLRFNGSNSFDIRVSVAKRVGPALVQQLTIGFASTKLAELQINAHADIAFALGPLIVSIVDTGVSFNIINLTNPKDLSYGFDLPKGVGIEVISDTITGGGYLYLDPAHHQYAGVANLKLKTTGQEINLNALGLLQTELPGNPDAYSLLLLITATFTPIQLGLGFTLNGIGGLLGVNRATDTDYLRGLVRGGHLDQLLFPANVLDNPAAALAIVDAAFPATEGRYVIGLLARLGWGTPTSLITLYVALLIELPSPVRLAILGVLEATLPSKDQDLLKLRADFLGTVDFGSKRAAFDATLSDSHLLAFALTGDLAFRFYQGNNPLFVITAGGFHPAFQPPAGAGLTGLRRLTLSLARGNDLRVTLTSYFAVTSNTVQFGSCLELYYRIARGLHVQGYFGFDVLFQFNPFHVQAHVEAGVAVKYGSRELLSLHLSLDVTGPGPWHLWGSASFKVWFVRIRVNVDATIGGGSTEPALPATDVRALLVTALDAAASWEVEAPKTALPGGVVLRPVGTTSADFFLDPRGSLLLRQRVVPLGVQLGKYGRGPIALNSGQRFDLTELVVAGVHHPVATDKDVETVRDFFAPDQFQPLTDAQKLSLPSFQLLPCGLRLNSMAGLVADEKATLRVVEYEHKLLDGTSGGATTSRPPKMSARGYQQLVRGGALGQEVDAARPSARAPQPVNWAEDAFVVVHAATLEVYDPAGHARFATQVEAEQYRQALVAATPALAGEVLVVPAYQLELA